MTPDEARELRELWEAMDGQMEIPMEGPDAG